MVAMKALGVVKAAVTRWLSHGAACKRCRERYGMIVGALDEIITRNPKAELVGYRSELLKASTILQITFLEDVLSVTNTLSLVLQSDHKDFGAVRRAMTSTITVLKNMVADKDSIHLKRFRSYNDVLSQIESFDAQKVTARGTHKKIKID